MWGLIASLFIANAMLLVLNLPLVGLWVRLLAIPQPWLYAGILVFATMGTIAAKPSVVELIMLGGVRRAGLPDAALRLSDRAGGGRADPRPGGGEPVAPRAAISLGDPLVLVQSPMSATLLAIAFIALIAPFVMRGLGRFKSDAD